MKKVLLTVLTIILAFTVEAQYLNLKKLEVNVGASIFAPISKDISSDNRAWGQRVYLVAPRNDKFAYTLTLGYQQDRDRFVQMPALLGFRHKAYKNLYVSVGAGATFFKNENPRFTLTPAIGYQHKRLYIEQSLFRTTKFNKLPLDADHFNNIGFSLFYKL